MHERIIVHPNTFLLLLVVFVPLVDLDQALEGGDVSHPKIDTTSLAVLVPGTGIRSYRTVNRPTFVCIGRRCIQRHYQDCFYSYQS